MPIEERESRIATNPHESPRMKVNSSVRIRLRSYRDLVQRDVTFPRAAPRNMAQPGATFCARAQWRDQSQPPKKSPYVRGRSGVTTAARRRKRKDGLCL